MSGIIMDCYRYAPPVAADFPHIYGTNSVVPTLTDTTGRGLVMDFGLSPIGTGPNVRAATKNKPTGTSTYDIIARVQGFKNCGICVTDGTKFVTFGFTNAVFGDGAGLLVTRYTNVTTSSADRLSGQTPRDTMEWLKIGVVAGDPSTLSVSQNGTDWVEYLSDSPTGFLTYTEVGIYQMVDRAQSIIAVSGTNEATLSTLYYSDADIVPGV